MTTIPAQTFTVSNLNYSTNSRWDTSIQPRFEQQYSLTKPLLSRHFVNDLKTFALIDGPSSSATLRWHNSTPQLSAGAVFVLILQQLFNCYTTLPLLVASTHTNDQLILYSTAHLRIECSVHRSCNNTSWALSLLSQNSNTVSSSQQYFMLFHLCRLCCIISPATRILRIPQITGF